jgi:hypothetical protein
MRLSEFGVNMRWIHILIVLGLASVAINAQRQNSGPIYAGRTQPNLWLEQVKKIRPLVSTEKEIQGILGAPSSMYSDYAEYTTKDGVFTVLYSHGTCDQLRTPYYKVVAGIVISFDFDPRREIVFSTLDIDISKWNNEKTPDVSPPTITYVNEEKGIELTVHQGLLNYVEVYPSKSQSNLKCPENE